MIFIIPKNCIVSFGWILVFLLTYPYKMKQTYSGKEKLKSKKLIEQMFDEGDSVLAYPLRLVYLETSFDDGSQFKTGVSVSKRHFKKAVDRNHIKRLLREAYRLHKDVYFNNITTQYAFMILYIGNHKPTLVQLETKMKLLFEKFLKSVSGN